MACVHVQLKQATVHDEAARKCSDLIAQSEEIWESCGRHISSREVQHLVHHQGFPPSTTLHGSGCIMKTAREVILSLEASVRAAQQVLLACPGYKEIVSLDPSDPDICCWGWTVDGTRYGPYSLKDLRCWVKMGSIQSDGLISHSSQPDRYANIHEVCPIGVMNIRLDIVQLYVYMQRKLLFSYCSQCNMLNS